MLGTRVGVNRFRVTHPEWDGVFVNATNTDAALRMGYARMLQDIARRNLTPPDQFADAATFLASGAKATPSNRG